MVDGPDHGYTGRSLCEDLENPKSREIAQIQTGNDQIGLNFGEERQELSGGCAYQYMSMGRSNALLELLSHQLSIIDHQDQLSLGRARPVAIRALKAMVGHDGETPLDKGPR